MKKLLVGLILSISIFSLYNLPVNANDVVTSSDYLEATASYESEIVDVTNHIYSFHEMESDILSLSLRYPKLISFTSLGFSMDNRNIWEVIVGNPDAPKSIYVQAGIHGREWMNCWLLMKQIETICMNPSYHPLLNEINLCIIPMVNPDGVTISQFGIGAITDVTLQQQLYTMPGSNNPSLWKANACGVDLNRNFGVGWGAVVNSTTPCSQNYNGTAAFTEPEVLAVVSAFQNKKYELAISYHSMEGAIYWNLGQTGTLYQKTQLLATQASRITGYRLGVKSQVHGLDYNWMSFDQQTPTILIETGTVACPLPYSQWNEIWNRNKDLLIQLAYLYY